jgi:hypothetical protein
MAARLAARARPGSEHQDVARALRRTDGLIKEAREIAESRNSARLKNQVREAAELQNRAHRQLKHRNYGDANRLTLKARDVLTSAIGTERPAVGKIEVRDALTVTDNEIRRIRGILGDTRNREIIDAIAQAMKEQETAWEAFNERRLRAALARTRIARNLARQALEIGITD